jgi:hypothetical protein
LNVRIEELHAMDVSQLQGAPKQRTEGLVVREVDDEVIVYDLARHEAHCLNPEAARIWRACDGQRDAGALLDHLYGEAAAGDDSTGFALHAGLVDLNKRHLFDEALELPPLAESPGSKSRREFFGSLGKAAAVAVALPTVISIVAPTPAEASTCQGTGESCSTSSECCSGLCNGTVCA